jgi:CubicO group peptidase (beta-lactamase class C family)
MKYCLIAIAALILMNSCITDKREMRLVRELDSLLAAGFRSDEPGGSVMIMKGEYPLFMKNYGLSDLRTREKNTENTLYNLGSISKTFVANGILILAENGSLTLDDSLSMYFPEFRNKEIADEVHIWHLLSHTSGLPDNRPVSENPDFFITAKDYENFAPVMETEVLNFTPGERFEYSNPAFNGLALIIEKVSGQKWQRFITDSIFTPAGMVTSTITDGSHPEAGVAHGYELEGGIWVESDYGEYPTFPAAGNGGVWSSLTGLARYENAIRTNLFLGPELTEQSRTIFRPDNWIDTLAPSIGCSWFIGEEQFMGAENNFGVRFIYHTGDQGGFRAFYVEIPEKQILYVGLFNRPPEDMKAIIMTGLSLLQQNNWFDSK